MQAFEPSRPNKHATPGFTLLELLVAMTILAGLLAVTYSGMRVAFTMWEKSNERAQAAEQRGTVLTVLREQIAGALPLLYVEAGEVPRQHLAFQGRADGLTFASGSSWKDGTRTAPRWIQLSWNGHLQVDERRILSPSNSPDGASSWHLDLTTFQEFRLKYLPRTRADQLPVWTEVWNIDERRELPAAVGIHYKAGGAEEFLVIPLDYAEASAQGFQLQ